MSKKNENKLLPKFRFPEFNNDGEWEVKKLDEIAEIKRGAASQHLKYVDKNHPNAIRLLRINDFLNDDAVYVEDTPDMKRFRVKTTDILIAGTGATAGITFIVESKFNDLAYSYNAPRIRVKNINSQFVYHYLKSDSIIQQQKRFFVGNAQPFLDTTAIGNLKIFISSSNEQQKIAACLSTLDEVITAESHKLEVLKDHKKGLLQNLLPQAGETVPKFRFKEFEDSGEWVEKRVEDYFDVGSSKRVLQQDWASQGVPFYRTRELVSLSKHEPFGSEIFISEELYNDLKVNYGIPTIGDFLVSGVGTLGICYQVKQNDRFYFKDGNVIWFKLKGDLNSTYFKYCFESEHIQNQIVGQTSKSTVGTYTIQNAKKTKFWFAPATKEQEKIADTLSSIDELIIAQGQKLEAMQQHKKGLLQGLFPNLNEVTA
ncbi:restriction endonuclease subunit S [Saprospiraceae bacterium]